MALGLVAGCSRAPEPGEPIAAARIFGGLGDTPGRFGYPRCLAVDPVSSTLWVIDRTARVQRIDPESGRCLNFFHTPEHAAGKPTGCCVAPGIDEAGEWRSNLLYVADTHYHRVLVYHAPDAAKDERSRGSELAPFATFGAYGRGDGEFIYPTDVAVLLAADGRGVERIYVSEYGGNDRISVFSGAPGFKFLFAFGSFGTSADPARTEFNRPQSIVVDSGHAPARLVVTDSCNHRVGVFTLDGALVRWIGTADAASGAEIPPLPSTIDIPLLPAAGAARIATVGAPARFLYPYGLAVLPDGTALISEFGAARVQQIDLESGVCLASWGRPGREPGELAAPWSVAVLDRTVYVLDSGNSRVVAFPAPGRGGRF